MHCAAAESFSQATWPEYLWDGDSNPDQGGLPDREALDDLSPEGIEGVSEGDTVAFYASVVLGLEVELRAKGKSVGHGGWRRIFPFRRSAMDPALAPPSHVVVYIDAVGKLGDGVAAVSECVGKESFN